MSDKLTIRNWDKWQSYRRDRGQPPWIKVHRCIMRNPDWVEMTDAQRGQLVAMWLLAADHDGVIPASPTLLQKLCFMDSQPNLELFVSKGFINDDASVTPTRRQHDQPETETETEEIKTCSEPQAVHEPPDASFDDFWSAWPRHHRKIGKAKCIAFWRNNKLNQIADRVIAAVGIAKQSRDWRKNEGEFIPAPISWLRNTPWETDATDLRSPAASQQSPKAEPYLARLEKTLGELLSYHQSGDKYAARRARAELHGKSDAIRNDPAIDAMMRRFDEPVGAPRTCGATNEA